MDQCEPLTPQAMSSHSAKLAQDGDLSSVQLVTVATAAVVSTVGISLILKPSIVLTWFGAGCDEGAKLMARRAGVLACVYGAFNATSFALLKRGERAPQLVATGVGAAGLLGMAALGTLEYFTNEKVQPAVGILHAAGVEIVLGAASIAAARELM